MKKSIFVDSTNLIKAEVTYNTWKDTSYKGMLKGAGGMVSSAVKWGLEKKIKVDENIPKKRADDFFVQIYRIDKSELDQSVVQTGLSPDDLEEEKSDQSLDT